ncbi:hypothetical protein K8R66_01520 [bacterium]|nr:hypothetical protein [bacterium]
MDEKIRAVITKIQKGKNNKGDFVICLNKKDKSKGSITFSIRIWKEESIPEVNQEVILGSIIKTGKGFRARQARSVTISD